MGTEFATPGYDDAKEIEAGMTAAVQKIEPAVGECA
jgi:hypothetical protein